jgi:hypothetical protein
VLQLLIKLILMAEMLLNPSQVHPLHLQPYHSGKHCMLTAYVSPLLQVHPSTYVLCFRPCCRYMRYIYNNVSAVPS